MSKKWARKNSGNILTFKISIWYNVFKKLENYDLFSKIEVR